MSLSDDELNVLRNIHRGAHVGTDLEIVCREAAEEIRSLRRSLQSAQTAAIKHRDAIKKYAITSNTYELLQYANQSGIHRKV